MQRAGRCNGFRKLIYGLAFLLFTIILVTDIFADITVFTWKKDFLIRNIVLIAVAGLFWWVLDRLWQKKRYHKKHTLWASKWTLLGAVILLFILQVWVSYQIFFETGWDPAAVIAEVRNIIEDRGINWQWYFQAYPNNLTIAQIYYWILRVNRALHLFSGEYELMAIVVVNCAVSSLTCMLVWLTAREISGGNHRICWLSWTLSALLTGLSPWMVVTYTDSLGLIFPISILYLYFRVSKTNSNRKKVLGWTLLLILGYVGYLIKPQAVIMLIAIVLAELWKRVRGFLADRQEKGFRRTIAAPFCRLTLVLLMTCTVIVGIQMEKSRWQNSRGFIEDSEKSMDPLHYLNMGLNTEQDGAFLQADLDRSAKFATKSERDQYNLESAKTRVKSMGISGLARHLAKKMMVLYADGTFAWACEPDFWQTMLPEAENSQSGMRTQHFLRELYYEDGQYYRLFETAEQLVWMLVLTGCWITSAKELAKLKNAENMPMTEEELPDHFYLPIALSLLGLTMFELIFEARARYLYIYAPVFVLMAFLSIFMSNDLNEMKRIDKIIIGFSSEE